ncbi:hypothetical protein ILYODFUR_015085 [Ilyodon furcidens]|uniref:Uncharacterized protein n=1 Tax=Ilyodon furcidens TaxID=33524 RepID=A0ABV0U5J0_9TELE
MKKKNSPCFELVGDTVCLLEKVCRRTKSRGRSQPGSSLSFDSAGVPAPGGRPGPSDLPAHAGLIPLPEFASVTHRFLLKTENQSTPLCFDINGSIILKLLDHPSKEVYVNGELDSVTNGGFSRIFIHAGSDQHVEVEPDGFRQGRTAIHQPANDRVTTGRITVLRHQYNEFDIAVEDVRLVILVHEKDGNRFLWAVLRQRPFANNIKGILALKPADYEEIESSPSTKLKIKDTEIIVISSTADDYSIIKPVPMHCWLTSTRYALEKPLNDYIAAQL